MSKPVVRLAENSDGEAVKAILVSQGPFDASIPFTDIHPYWLVAELTGKGIVGCIQTAPSRPIGHLEMLATVGGLTSTENGEVVRELLMAGLAILNYHGASRAAGFVPFELKGYKRVLQKRGAVIADSGNLLMRRLA